MTLGRYTFVAVAVAFCANIKLAYATDDIDARTITTGLLVETANRKSDSDESLEERGFFSSELARTNLVATSSSGGVVTHGQPKVPQKS
ncbi:hypothetical protein Plhal304r1_c001g0002421 [Plasmopara halstedii]